MLFTNSKIRFFMGRATLKKKFFTNAKSMPIMAYHSQRGCGVKIHNSLLLRMSHGGHVFSVFAPNLRLLWCNFRYFISLVLGFGASLGRPRDRFISDHVLHT